MSEKLNAFRYILRELGAVFPDLTVNREIYLTPLIKALPSMSSLEIQVAEQDAVYEIIAGDCRSEDFVVLVGIFRKYSLDSGGRHAKALSDLNLSIIELKELVVSALDGEFLKDETLTRPLIIRDESGVSEPQSGQLLKIVRFTAGLNSVLGEDYAEFPR